MTVNVLFPPGHLEVEKKFYLWNWIYSRDLDGVLPLIKDP